MVAPIDLAQGVATRTVAKMVIFLLAFLVGPCTCELTNSSVLIQSTELMEFESQ